MAFAFADRVWEQASHSGTGSVTLSATAVTGGYQSFLAGWGASGSGFYEISGGNQWEVGYGTINAGGTTLTRSPIAGSSGAATLVNFSAGTKNIIGVEPAAAIQELDTQDYLINGNGQVNQAVPTSNADDTYGHDQWIALTQTGAIAVSTVTDVANGLRSMMRLTQSQAAAQRMGYLQIMEAGRCKDLRGRVVSFGGKFRYSLAAAIRFAIIEWTGTADAVTSDVVFDWTNGTFTGGSFFFGTNQTITAVGAITPSAATVTDFLLTTTLANSHNNVMVMMWTEGTAAQNATLDIAASFKRGYTVAPLFWRDPQTEIALCQRYYEQSYNMGIAPGTASSLLGLHRLVVPANTVVNNQYYGQIGHRVAKRITPTVTIYGFAGGSGKVSDGSGIDLAANSGSIADAGHSGFSILNNSGSSITTTNNAVLLHWTSEARL